jgi:hypothetical protein
MRRRPSPLHPNPELKRLLEHHEFERPRVRSHSNLIRVAYEVSATFSSSPSEKPSSLCLNSIMSNSSGGFASECGIKRGILKHPGAAHGFEKESRLTPPRHTGAGGRSEQRLRPRRARAWSYDKKTRPKNSAIADSMSGWSLSIVAT